MASSFMQCLPPRIGGGSVEENLNLRGNVVGQTDQLGHGGRGTGIRRRSGSFGERIVNDINRVTGGQEVSAVGLCGCSGSQIISHHWACFAYPRDRGDEATRLGGRVKYRVQPLFDDQEPAGRPRFGQGPA